VRFLNMEKDMMVGLLQHPAVAEARVSPQRVQSHDFLKCVEDLLLSVQEPWQVLRAFANNAALVSCVHRHASAVAGAPHGPTIWQVICHCARFYVAAQAGEYTLFDRPLAASDVPFLYDTQRKTVTNAVIVVMSVLSTRAGGMRNNPLVSMLFSTNELVRLSNSGAGRQFDHTMPARFDSVMQTCDIWLGSLFSPLVDYLLLPQPHCRALSVMSWFNGVSLELAINRSRHALNLMCKCVT
jgi:hypothetical protein